MGLISTTIISVFLGKKYLFHLKVGNFYSSFQSISKASPVTFKDFLEAVTKLVPVSRCNSFQRNWHNCVFSYRSIKHSDCILLNEDEMKLHLSDYML